MRTDSYWDRVMRKRLSRRRALAGTAGAGLGAAFLAACGGEDTPPAPAATTPPGTTPAAPAATPTPQPAGLLHTPVSTTAQAQPGGTLRHYAVADIIHFDAVTDSSGNVVSLSSSPFHTRMLRLAAVPYPEEADGSSEGETAESWEISPDRLSITFRLRNGMVWDRRPPTNGRQIDAHDVVFSWEKYKELNANSAALAYDAQFAPDAPVESVTATDDRTVVVRLHQPYAEIIPMFSAYDLLYLQAREADGGFDPRTTVRGAGPYILQDYVPAGGFTWARNPDFYIEGRPFPDLVEVPIVEDYATRLAQFRAGNIMTDVVVAAQEDVVVTKRDVPAINLMQEANFSASSTNMVCFGWKDDAPWHDTRVRQALSMMIDREAWIDTVDNRDAFMRDGLEVQVRQNSAIPGGWEGYWLDPTNESEFGANAKYLNYNPEEAQKLLTAAGYPNGFDFDIFMGTGYGGGYARIVELYDGMFRNGGLRPQIREITPSAVWLSEYSRIYRSATVAAKRAAGEDYGFSGVAVVPERLYTTAALQVLAQYNRGGSGYRGMKVEGGDIVDGDPHLNELTVKIIQEFDRDEQISLVQDLIRYTAQQMYYVPRPSSARPFSAWWPSVGNVLAYRSYINSGVWTDQRRNWWVDGSKAPLSR